LKELNLEDLKITYVRAGEDAEEAGGPQARIVVAEGQAKRSSLIT
jgi:hypothetical protein